MSITNCHIQGLIELMRNDFQLQVWDGDLDLNLPPNRKIVIEKILSICSKELNLGQQVQRFPANSPVAVVCQLPLYFTKMQYEFAWPYFATPQDCTVLLTLVYNNFLDDHLDYYVWPVVVVRQEGKPNTQVRKGQWYK